MDGSRFDEFKRRYAPTIVTGFARLHGMLVGIIANNGVLFSESALKAHALHRAVQHARRAAGVPAEHHRASWSGSSTSAAASPRTAPRWCTRWPTRVVPKFTVVIGGSFGAGNYGMCGRAYDPRFLWMWPNARISVMGGEQAAAVLARSSAISWRARAGRSSAEEEARIRQPILEKYEREGSPYYSTARLWDDGILDPAAHARRAGARRLGRLQRADPAGPLRHLQDVTVFTRVLWPTAGRLRCASCARAARWASKRWRSIPTPTRGALHVTLADRAVRIGGAAASESYLSIGRDPRCRPRRDWRPCHSSRLRLPVRERRVCRRLRGGRPRVHRPAAGGDGELGSKTAARALAEAAGVPVVPGESARRPERCGTLQRRGARVGFPVLLKPSEGGGGIGMKAVHGRAPTCRRGDRPGPARGRGRLRRRHALRRAARRAAAPRRVPDPRRPAWHAWCTCSSASARSSAGIRR